MQAANILEECHDHRSGHSKWWLRAALRCAQTAGAGILRECPARCGGRRRIVALFGLRRAIPFACSLFSHGRTPACCLPFPPMFGIPIRLSRRTAPQAHMFEREIAEQWRIEPVGHPWLKPVRFQRPRRDGTEFPAKQSSAGRLRRDELSSRLRVRKFTRWL